MVKKIIDTGKQVRRIEHEEFAAALGADKAVALVLCKHELFYQDKDGKTLFTEYPVSLEDAIKKAKLLGVEFHEA